MQQENLSAMGDIKTPLMLHSRSNKCLFGCAVCRLGPTIAALIVEKAKSEKEA